VNLLEHLVDVRGVLSEEEEEEEEGV
jgi:hypothetical protein